MTSKLGESGFLSIILLYFALDHKLLNKVSSLKKTFSKCYKLLHMWLQDLQKQWQMVVIIKTKKKKKITLVYVEQIFLKVKSIGHSVMFDSATP